MRIKKTVYLVFVGKNKMYVNSLDFQEILLQNCINHLKLLSQISLPGMVSLQVLRLNNMNSGLLPFYIFFSVQLYPFLSPVQTYRPL